jgi:MFS family permease
VIPRVTKTLLRFDRRVWLLLFAMLAFRFGHGLYFPFSSIYFHNVLGIPLSLVGTGLAVFAAVSVLSGLVAGLLTDRYGRKPVMLTALAGSAASFFAFSLVGAALFAASSVTLLMTGSFLGIFVAFVVFFTMAEMVLEVAGASLAAELAPTQLRGTYLALFGACFGVAYGFSPIVAGTLLQARLPALIWTIQLVAAASAAAGLVTLVLLRRRRPVRGA